MSALLRRMMLRQYLAPDPDPAGGAPSSGPAPSPSQAPAEPQTFSREYVRELREEAATQRRSRQEAEAQAKTHEENAKKAAAEAEAKVTAAQTAANDRIIRAELKAEALKAGMVDLDGLKLADLSKVKLNAETGEVEGAEALMTDLKKAKPFLFGAPASTSHAGTKPPKPGDPEVKDARTMTAEEYAKERAKIRRGELPTAKA